MKQQGDTQSMETVQRILRAAREVFVKKGLDGARLHEIAALSDTNQGLIIYHFRNKDKLYQLVMLEELSVFFRMNVPILSDRSTSLEEKIALMVERYFAMAEMGPHLSMFILNEMLKGHSGLKNQIKKQRNMLHRSVMAEQLREAIKAGKYRNINFSELLINIIGLTIFPIIAAPVMQTAGGLSEEEYQRMLLDRRKRVYEWVLVMMR
jgi:AcrR family transcriptional regulator